MGFSTLQKVTERRSVTFVLLSPVADLELDLPAPEDVTVERIKAATDTSSF